MDVHWQHLLECSDLWDWAHLSPADPRLHVSAYLILLLTVISSEFPPGHLSLPFPRACNELICLCRLDFSIYRFMISICMLVYFVYGGGYVTCMLWLMPWDQRTTRGRLSSPSTRDWNQIIRLGSKYPYLLNHLTGPIYPRDLYFPPLLFKTGSGNYCWLLTCTWW